MSRLYFRLRGYFSNPQVGYSCRKRLFHLMSISGGQLVLLAKRAVAPKGRHHRSK